MRRTAYGSPVTKSYQESTYAAGAGIAFGQVVQFDQTDTAAFRIRRASTMTGQSPFLGTNIVGVSAEASTSDGSTTGLSDYRNRRISVWEATIGTEFRFPTKVVIASTLVNTALELSWDSTMFIHHLSANSTAGDQTVIVTGVDSTAVGDTGGYLYGRFMSSVVARAVNGL